MPCNINCYPATDALKTSKNFALTSSIRGQLQKLSTQRDRRDLSTSPQIILYRDLMLDFLTLFFSLVEFQGDKLAGLGVQVPWQE